MECNIFVVPYITKNLFKIEENSMHIEKMTIYDFAGTQFEIFSYQLTEDKIVPV